MYFVNPDYIVQVVLESQPRHPRNKGRAVRSSRRQQSDHSRLWTLVHFGHGAG
jgi:hypothetical protein